MRPGILGGQCAQKAYDDSRYRAIIFKISDSLRELSSNPGVSTNTIERPNSLNGGAICTALVQDSRPCPISKFDPLARLTNYVTKTVKMSP